jgi:salicylate hydroxylase
VYECQGADFEGLSYEECLPIIKRKLKSRMRWVWGGDIEGDYEAVAGKIRRLKN